MVSLPVWRPAYVFVPSSSRTCTETRIRCPACETHKTSFVTARPSNIIISFFACACSASCELFLSGLEKENAALHSSTADTPVRKGDDRGEASLFFWSATAQRRRQIKREVSLRMEIDKTGKVSQILYFSREKSKRGVFSRMSLLGHERFTEEVIACPPSRETKRRETEQRRTLLL